MNCQFVPLNPNDLKAVTRRQFFGRCAVGLGSIALGSLLNEKLFAADPALDINPLAPKPPHFAPKAKRAIYLFMAGAPSHLDLFDYKPEMKKLDGKPCPESFIKGQRFAFIKGDPKMLATMYKFHRHGQCRMQLSELLPHLGEVADDITLVRSMVTEAFNHAPAQIYVNTGIIRMGRPSLGSWLMYGIGSESQNLPGFVVLLSGGGQPSGGTACWGSGFLPSQYQGVRFRSQGDPILFVSNPPGMNAASRRDSLDAIKDLNAMQYGSNGNWETVTRISAYEMAFRMQTSAPELMDIDQEPEWVRKMYGTEPGKVSFANNCLLARRLIERGVRFVQLYHRGWDTHGTSASDDLIHALPKQCRDTDRAAAALIKDLKMRGLLDETLVVWGGEFGRTPMDEARNGSKFLGRDHHPHCFSLWMAGGGVKSGYIHGETDPFGFTVVKDPVHIHDLQATILRCFGLDHTRLTYKYQGRDFRLTDVGGQVIDKLLA